MLSSILNMSVRNFLAVRQETHRSFVQRSSAVKIGSNSTRVSSLSPYRRHVTLMARFVAVSGAESAIFAPNRLRYPIQIRAPQKAIRSTSSQTIRSSHSQGLRGHGSVMLLYGHHIRHVDLHLRNASSIVKMALGKSAKDFLDT